MADQFRDTCVDRQNKNRKSFRGNPLDPIRISFYDKDGQRINDVTRSEANCIAKQNPEQKFYYQDGGGYQRELLIDQVNALSILDSLPKAPNCPSNPQPCGPPRVQFFGGMGMGAMANTIISPNSKSIIGFDIVNPGFNYLNPPFANIVDECGNGSGGSLVVQTRPYSGGDPSKGGLEIKNIVIAAPGDGYLPAPDGSLGGNGRVWKYPEEGYVERSDGSIYPVPSGVIPENLPEGDIFYAPQIPQTPNQQTLPTTYPVVTQIDEIFVADPGFGYEIGDTVQVVSTDGTNSGAELRPVINDRGEIIQVKVIKPGIGFIDLPEIVIDSPRGYNAKLIPVLKVTPLSQIADPAIITPEINVISVVDCVGRIPPRETFDVVLR